MLKAYHKPEKTPEDLNKYINMCKRAKEDEDIAEFSGRYFEEGDFFHNSTIGVAVVEKLGAGYFYCSHPELKTAKIPTEECTWLPTVEQIKEMIRSNSLFDGELEEERVDSKKFFKTQEEKWLAEFMLERYGKIWMAPEAEWKEK